jgi:dTMP kinase
MAYQGYGQGADKPFIKELSRLLEIVPALTLVLDVPEDIGAARMRERGGDADRYEKLDAAFHARVRQGYREIAAAEPDRCVLVDASADVDAVHAAILDAVETRL